ncbi:hypothetical protein [Nocardia wallacei]|uniref:hypothetical protein n=1 Tax=Nocardia wallacei TaxID=480035 RepID=UPI002456B415|nr:hypothetical protein [Nocardia wallacei]
MDVEKRLAAAARNLAQQVESVDVDRAVQGIMAAVDALDDDSNDPASNHGTGAAIESTGRRTRLGLTGMSRSVNRNWGRKSREAKKEKGNSSLRKMP